MSSFPNPSVILNAVPDNSTITFAQFTQTVGPEIANGIAFASPLTFTRSGAHITIKCAKAGSVTAGSATIKTSTEISFDATISGAVTSVTNISGISASESGGSGSVKSLTITQLANGNYMIAGSVSVLFFSVPFNVEITPEGQVVSSAKAQVRFYHRWATKVAG